jgi:hypothetical protein
MYADRFDGLVRSVALPLGRRGLLGLIGVLVSPVLVWPGTVTAVEPGMERSLCRKNPTCTPPGRSCTSNKPCCSASTCHRSTGRCECPRSKPQTCCWQCVNLKSDRRNCGKCGRQCEKGKICKQGSCQCESSNFLECAGACIDPSTNSQHCGGCGKSCSPETKCIEGVCRCLSESCLSVTQAGSA